MACNTLMERIRIVLAEDHALVREGTRRILDQQPDFAVVGEAGDGEAALDLAQRIRPDVLVLDVRMPKMTGIEVVRRLKAAAPETRTIVLTAYDDDEYVLALMEAGVSGYLLKTVRASELVEAIRTVQAGEPVLSAAIASKVARLWATARESQPRRATDQLSARELEVLALAAEGARNKAIADQLGLSVRTVEGHFNSILTKLAVSSRLEAVLHAVSHRWVAPEEERRL